MEKIHTRVNYRQIDHRTNKRRSKGTENILLLYGKLEFGWNVSAEKTRKYFFSQKVVLFFILKILEIDLEVPVLKNKDRTEEQLRRMCDILKTPGLF